MRPTLWTPEGRAKNVKPNRRWRKGQRMAWTFAFSPPPLTSPPPPRTRDDRREDGPRDGGSGS